MNEIVANENMAEAHQLLATPVDAVAVNPVDASKVYIDSPEATSAEEPIEAVN